MVISLVTLQKHFPRWDSNSSLKGFDRNRGKNVRQLVFYANTYLIGEKKVIQFEGVHVYTTAISKESPSHDVYFEIE